MGAGAYEPSRRAVADSGDLGVETEFNHPVDCLAARRHPEPAVEGVHLALHRVPGDEQPVADLGEREVGWAAAVAVAVRQS